MSRWKQIGPYILPFCAVAVMAAFTVPAVRQHLRSAWRDRRAEYVAPERHPPADAVAFAQYAGSESCRDCHREAYDLWRRSNHGMAERLPDPALDDAAFVPPRTFAHGSQQTMASGSQGVYRVAAVGRGGQTETVTVTRVIGHDPLRQFLVPFPGGRLQTLEAAYDPNSNAWFNVYGDEDRRPGEWGHWTGRGMNWNNMCAACHNTRVRKNYTETNDSYQTTMAERTVGCEACHGPLKAHVTWRLAHTNTFARDPTVQSHSPAQFMETCGTCHSRRMELTGDFVPGDRFDDHHVLSIVDGSDTYYPDAQVREEDYEYAAFLGSHMGNAGVRCADCHQSHSARLLLPGNLVCMRCHMPGGYANAPVIDPAAHGHHQLDPLYTVSNGVDVVALADRDPSAVWRSGGECVNCHMPQTYYMQRHRRHDHGMTIPDPLLTKLYGIPNACNRCHMDKTTDWALEWTQQWYGDKMDRAYRRRAHVVAAARTGENSARAGLLAMLTTDTNAYWRAVAAGLLERWVNDPGVRSALLAATQHSNALVRARAADSLGALVQTEAGAAVVPRLRQVLGDPVRSVRRSAAWALRGEIDPESDAGRELASLLDYAADQPPGQMQKGAYYLARGNLPQAVEHYRRAADWDPNSAPIRHDFGIVLARQGAGNDAVQQFAAACRLEPGNGEFRYKLALAWNEAGRADEALANLREAVKLDPRHGRAWYNLGLAHAGTDQLDESAAALRQAADLLPGPEAPYALATVCVRQGRLSAASDAVAEALRRDPNHSAARELQAVLATGAAR